MFLALFVQMGCRSFLLLFALRGSLFELCHGRLQLHGFGPGGFRCFLGLPGALPFCFLPKARSLSLFRITHADIGRQHVQQGFGVDGVISLMQAEGQPFEPIGPRVRLPGQARKIGGLDNRGSHFYLALYWAQALAAQDEDPGLKALFAPLAERLAADEAVIVGELNGVQGKPVEIGGYYHPALDKAGAAMRPSATFNAALQSLGQ